MFRNVAELVERAEREQIKIAEVMIRQEMEVTERSREDIVAQMEKNLQVMEQAVLRGLAGVRSHTGLTGGDATRLQQYIVRGQFLSGETILDAVSKAMAIALKNMLGLVCDPVAGLVEVPCVKRNAIGAANAMIAADMALAGIQSRIPCDEVIEAMFRIGQTMPVALKETAQGGLAATPTARRFEASIFGKPNEKRE
ncbi:Serine dehydratase alpha chain [Anoxybacillus pushchinoensis]|uniref:L-serine ammonia-lyase n=1 Tax=Anoxybacillus pushchinoensis TaxID=150248 RepID=A0A1I0SGG2_9BACL|nr:L-serine ammonia-lyase, iron-sulfur-dependent, subunit alpha [Anoxybacillus pushchinoensis]SFA38527.1 Serine dehydratase alpha chain [Anoxybacillus pushchinoensis]